MTDDIVVISVYSLEQALEDGTLVAVFQEDWSWLSGGKPIVATARIVADIPEADLKQIWNAFVQQRTQALRANMRPFAEVQYNGATVWVNEDDDSVAFMYPDEY